MLKDGNKLIVATLQHFVKVLSEDYVLPDFLKHNPTLVKRNFVRDVRAWISELTKILIEQGAKLYVPVPLKIEIQDTDQKLFEQIRKLI